MRRIQHSGPAHARTSGGRDNLSTLKDFAAGRLEPMRCYSPLMPASRMTLVHFAASDLSSAVHSSGVLATGS